MNHFKPTFFSLVLLAGCSEDEVVTPPPFVPATPPSVVEAAAPNCNDVVQRGGDAPVQWSDKSVDLPEAKDLPPVEDGIYTLALTETYGGNSFPATVQRATIVVRGSRWFAVVDDGEGTDITRWSYDVTYAAGTVTQTPTCTSAGSAGAAVSLRYSGYAGGMSLTSSANGILTSARYTRQ